jgi:hypothetical protein
MDTLIGVGFIAVLLIASVALLALVYDIIKRH